MPETFDVWQGWYRFDELYEYYGPIAEPGESKSKSVTYRGITGPLHTDNGFRLRSMNTGTFKSRPLRVSLDDVFCPLNRSDIGVYWIRVECKAIRYDYIGMSAEKKHGIYKRFMEHLNKIVGTSYLRPQLSDGHLFHDMRARLKVELGEEYYGSNDFLSQCVKFAFVKVKGSRKAEEKIAKIEGMALQSYKFQNGAFPNLNSRDETKGMQGFSDL